MIKELRPAVMNVLVFTILGGLVFPGLITVIAQTFFPLQANGSLVQKGGQVVGSSLVGQAFAAPGYFHPRPSAAGNGYDPTSSGGSNLGPTSDKLVNDVHKKLADGKDDPGNFDGVKDLATAYRTENNLPATEMIPPDAVTRSASGLDPDISPANAALQIQRVARTRHLSEQHVTDLVTSNTEERTFGLFGEPRVNVLKINMALDNAK